MTELNRPFSHNSGNKFTRELQPKYIPREQLLRPSLIEKVEIHEETEKVITAIVDEKTYVSQKATANQIKTGADSRFVKYTPKDSQMTRIVKVQEIQEDPFCPPQYKNKRIPHGPKGVPDVLLRAPPKKLTQEDQMNWKIPPCISNSKNSRGFVLPLEMRISADGRNSYDPKINERFMQFSTALYEAEKSARKELEEKNKIKQTLAYEELKKKEEELRQEIEETKRKKDSIFGMSDMPSKIESELQSAKDGEDSVAENQRELLRYMIKKNVEREARLERVGSNKLKEIRDKERDIAEKVALGQKADIRGGLGLEVDERVIGLGAGLDTGFKGDEAYDLYDKPLFHDAIKTNVYTGAKDFEDNYMDEGLGKRNSSKTDRDTHKARVLKRSKPVEFEKFTEDK